MAISDNKTSQLLKRVSESQKHIAPLVILRIVFGAVMLLSMIRFMLKGWIEEFYIKPQFHFTFYGFDWVRPLNETGMYLIFILMALGAALVMVGLFYRIAITFFFFAFTYVELIDKTFYLNHYYFISIFSFLMILVPAQRSFSLDVLRKPSLEVTYVPAWTINIFKLQLLIVYFFAGLSKLTFDWLIEAMPLKIWLPANAHLPVIGPLLTKQWVAYFFSWFGAIFDLSIGFLLLNRATIKPAYLFLVLFHLFTAWFFKIGMFPYVMIGATVIFFQEDFHKKLIEKLKTLFSKNKQVRQQHGTLVVSSWKKHILYSVLTLVFVIQLIIPFRFLFYPGNLLWTEQGYRFSWRVMLIEKSGTAFFYVSEKQTGARTEIINSRYLTRMQEKMMSTQPDMILQYAHYLHDEFQKKGMKDPVITSECFVTLNGSGSRLLADSSVDLAAQADDFSNKKWILPFKK